VAGQTYSFGAGGGDFWLLELNSDGTIAWQKTYGGSDEDRAYSVQQLTGGGYVVAGYTKSFGTGEEDLWVLDLDTNGEIPDCSAMGSSTISSHNTSVSGQDTTATPQDTSATTQDTSATTQDTSAQTSVVCSWSPSVYAWGYIYYGGMLQKNPVDGTVTVDTAIVVKNPNTWGKVEAGIVIFDKPGNKVWEGNLFDGDDLVPLQKANINQQGYHYITLGQAVTPSDANCHKYTYRIWLGPSANPEAKTPVVEVKEIVYETPTSDLYPLDADNIKICSETSLGGDSGTAWFPK
jgi:hypothetical protein